MGEVTFGDFRDLRIWQQSQDIRKKLWDLTKGLPKEETYRLSDQIIRASRSATACIAEGYGRYHYQENIQYCRQSRGSLYELIDHIDVARECRYIETEQTETLITEIKTTIKILNGYIKYLKNKKENK
ncbi:hypothetical protein ES705_43822 [subsurface metagenome]